MRDDERVRGERGELALESIAPSLEARSVGVGHERKPDVVAAAEPRPKGSGHLVAPFVRSLRPSAMDEENRSSHGSGLALSHGADEIANGLDICAGITTFYARFFDKGANRFRRGPRKVPLRVVAPEAT